MRFFRVTVMKKMILAKAKALVDELGELFELIIHVI